MQGIEEFGEQLIRTLDLDPVYIALARAGLEPGQLRRWLLAYWCFYHPGVASLVSEKQGDEYWGAMAVAAENVQPAPGGGRWPREPERRHFRGRKCVSAVTVLSRVSFSPETLVDSVCADSLPQVVGLVTRWPMFGPWIAFKAADMLERVLEVRIAFPEDTCLMYEGPRSALDVLAQMDPCRSAQEHYRHLLAHFSRFLAPPTFDRPCGPQEVETILCNWKSHVRGRYEVGKDVREMRHLLAGWGGTADSLLVALNAETRELA